MSYVEWTPDMGEISGFGGGYEACCRAMVKAGVEFWEAQNAAAARDERDPFNPEFTGFKNVYGLIISDNADAKALDAAIMAAPVTIDGKVGSISDYGATGAMHQAAIGHIMAFMRLGADEYVTQLRGREREEAAR